MNIDDMNLDLFEWSNGTKTQNAVLEADGVTVQDAVWEGKTPISANNLNLAQKKLAYALYSKMGKNENLETEDKETLVGAINEVKKPTQKVLLTTASYMNENQALTLSEPVSSQTNGIVFHWQGFNQTTLTPYDYDHVYHFVPKNHVISNNGKGIQMIMSNTDFGFVACKYIYLSDTKIQGNINNAKDGTGASGIKYTNRHWVLTEVLGV